MGYKRIISSFVLMALALLLVATVPLARAARLPGQGSEGASAAWGDVSAPAAGFTVNNVGDAGDASPGDGACETAPGNGVCTLRAAIEETNALSGSDIIDFDGSIVLVMPDSPLPGLDDASGGTTIRGDSTWILGSNAGAGTHGFRLYSDGNQLQGLMITGFDSSGVRIYGNNNVIGTDGDGLDDDSEGNVINSNGEQGVEISQGGTGNRVSGNLIGLTPDGLGPAGNAEKGIAIYGGAAANLIGTNGDGFSDELERNVISGNGQYGVEISGSDTSENVVAGNYIGTNISGTWAISNTWHGLMLSGGNANNRIGTDGNGLADGLEGNVISGNGGGGVRLDDGSSDNLIAGNYIGVNAAGDAAIPNDSNGLLIQDGSSNNLVGTNADGLADTLERNVVAGNDLAGIRIVGDGTDGNVVAGNYIGTNAAGDGAIPNGRRGVTVQSCANTRVGGTTAAERNLISGNGMDGIHVYSATATLVQGNYIGTDASGGSPLGNTDYGVNVTTGATGNFVGGTASGAGNLIAFNGLAGIRVSEYTTTNHLSYDNSLRGNAIFSNTELGIDLWPVEGITPNDPGDGDDGPNHLQNYPVLSGATADGAQILIEGSLDSAADTPFALDFYANTHCDPSGYGEGEIYLGTYTVTTDSGGDVSFSRVLTGAVPAGYAATATATDPDGNTSEFSACFIVVEGTACDPARDPLFNWTPAAPVAGEWVTFNGKANGTTPISFTWDFGDTATGAGTPVSHSYRLAGVYTVLMTATNCFSAPVSVTTTHTITVAEAPACVEVSGVRLAQVTTGTVYVGDTVTFRADIDPNDFGEPYTYTVYVGGGLVIDSQSNRDPLIFDHTFSNTGTTTVEIRVWNCDMRPAEAVVDDVKLTVYESGVCVPLESVTILGEATGYAGVEYTFDSEYTPTGASLPISYTWDDGGTDASSSRSFDLTGTYTLSVTATNCDDVQVSDEHVIVIEEAPSCVALSGVDLSLVNGSLYLGDQASLSADLAPDEATKPYSYTLDYGDGSEPVTGSNSDDPFAFNYTYAATGTYTVSFAAWNCEMTQPVSSTVQVVVTEPAAQAHIIYLPVVIRND